MANLLNKLVVSLMAQNALYLSEWPLSCFLLQTFAGACLEHLQWGQEGEQRQGAATYFHQKEEESDSASYNNALFGLLSCRFQIF